LSAVETKKTWHSWGGHGPPSRFESISFREAANQAASVSKTSSRSAALRRSGGMDGL
jgi:hypothetical protein